MALTTLFFDVGGVLLTNGWDHAERARAAAHFSLDAADIERRHVPLIEPFETGALSLDDYLTQVIFTAARPFSREAFIAFMESCSQPLRDSLALLPRLQAKGLRLATLNNEGTALNHYRIEKFQLRQYFSAFCSSCYLAARKPGPAIFERALGILHASPSECGFIDDRAENLITPRAIGLSCFQFTSAQQLAKDLCLD